MTTAVYIFALIGLSYVLLSIVALVSMAMAMRRNAEAADAYRRDAEARLQVLPEEVAAYRGAVLADSVQRQADEIVEAAWG